MTPKFCQFPANLFRQDCERSFNVNLRISVVQTSGPVGSASAVIAVSVLPLLLWSASSSSATYFIQAFASSTLWAVLLSLLHGLLLTPTLLLVFRDNLTTRPRSTTHSVAGSWWAVSTGYLSVCGYCYTRLLKAVCMVHSIESMTCGSCPCQFLSIFGACKRLFEHVCVVAFVVVYGSSAFLVLHCCLWIHQMWSHCFSFSLVYFSSRLSHSL